MSAGIHRPGICQPRLLLRFELDLDSDGDLLRHFALYDKYVAKLGVIALVPERALVACSDQTSIDSYPFA